MGRLFKSFIFDGKKSKDFGVYISGNAVYDAPEKDVEMIEIPGRDGELIIDNGRYKNIPVTYSASAKGNDQMDFSEKMEAFRNFLLSRKGYRRLEDEYNLGEFRLGVYKSGLQVDPIIHSRAGTFDLVFDCKPQRFLKSGEVEHAIENGGSIFNPTYFKSKPLIKAVGRGDISVNGLEFTINTDPVGIINVFDKSSVSQAFLAKSVMADVARAAGDTITVSGSSLVTTWRPPVNAVINSIVTDVISDGMEESDVILSNGGRLIKLDVPSVQFSVGTSQTKSYQAYLIVNTTIGGSQQTGLRIDLSMRFSYDGDRTVEVYCQADSTYMRMDTIDVTLGSGVVDSTMSALNKEIFIDCEICEAYIEEDGELISMDSALEIGAEFPELSPGKNTIAYDDTVTSFAIIPRWWRI